MLEARGSEEVAILLSCEDATAMVPSIRDENSMFSILSGFSAMLPGNNLKFCGMLNHAHRTTNANVYAHGNVSPPSSVSGVCFSE